MGVLRPRRCIGAGDVVKGPRGGRSRPRRNRGPHARGRAPLLLEARHSGTAANAVGRTAQHGHVSVARQFAGRDLAVELLTSSTRLARPRSRVGDRRQVVAPMTAVATCADARAAHRQLVVRWSFRMPMRRVNSSSSISPFANRSFRTSAAALSVEDETPARRDVRVTMRLRVIELADDAVRDRRDDNKEQNHDDQPRYSGTPEGTPMKTRPRTGPPGPNPKGPI